jgi:hypothetical protein
MGKGEGRDEAREQKPEDDKDDSENDHDVYLVSVWSGSHTPIGRRSNCASGRTGLRRVHNGSLPSRAAFDQLLLTTHRRAKAGNAAKAPR